MECNNSARIQDVKRRVQNAKADIRSGSVATFLTEASDRIAAMEADPSRIDELTDDIGRRYQVHTTADLSHVPPALLRHAGESVQTWIDRCYDAGGYVNAPEKVTRPATPFPEHLKPKKGEVSTMNSNSNSTGPLQTVKVITVLQPYAHYIIHGDSMIEFGNTVAPDKKDIENRTWPTRYRGRIYVHAGLRWYDDMSDDLDVFDDIIERMDRERGHIIGYVDLVDCVQLHQSPWFGGPFGFVLANPVVIDPIPARGRQGIWDHCIPVEQKAKSYVGNAGAIWEG